MNPNQPFEQIVHSANSPLESGALVGPAVMHRAVNAFSSRLRENGGTIFGEQIDSTGSRRDEKSSSFMSIDMNKATHMVRGLKMDEEGNVVATLTMVGPSSKNLLNNVADGILKFVPRMLAATVDDGNGGKIAQQCEIITVDLVNVGGVISTRRPPLYGLNLVHNNLIAEYGSEHVKRHDSDEEGQTYIDVKLNDKYVMVKFSTRFGFGLFYINPDPSDLMSVPEEIHQTAQKAFDRIKELIGPAYPEEELQLIKLLDVIHIDKNLSTHEEYVRGNALINRVQRMDAGERDCICLSFEKGPVDDGDVPSKSSRDTLVEEGFMAKVVVKGEEGFNACTYKGAMAYRLIKAGA